MFLNEGEIKIFLDKQKLKEFVASRSVLQEVLKEVLRTSLVVQGLRLHVPNAGGLGSIPGQGIRSHMHATTKDPTCCN